MGRVNRCGGSAAFRFATSLIALALIAVDPPIAAAVEPVRVDFTKAEELSRWRPTHDVAPPRAVDGGMEITISGADPFVTGPTLELPAGLAPDTPFLLEMKLRSEQGGMAEVFYYPEGGDAAAGKSVAARVAPGGWQDVRVAVPPLPRRVVLRFDPPGTSGRTVIASLVLQPRPRVAEPKWPAQGPLEVGAESALWVRSGDLSLLHDGKSPAGFAVRVGDEPMAVGMRRSLVGYVVGGVARWAELPSAAQVRAEGGAVVEHSSWRDADGANWRMDRRYRAGKVSGSIDVETRVTLDRDRDVLFLPALVLLPGAGSFGTGKTQALFAGLEYLDGPDTSSSEADVTGLASKRRVPDTRKVTFPLLALAAKGRYVGMLWDRAPSGSALFDSPDRTFHAGGHAMGLVFPGGPARTIGDGDLLPGESQLLAAGQPLIVRATLVGGSGTSVVPAIEQYVALRGLPPVPDTGLDDAAYVRVAAGGWLDSKLRDGNLVRHAVWPGFGAQPAADAGVFMRWLAARRGGESLAARLGDAARQVISAVESGGYDASHVSHITYPAAASLVFGHADENARAAEARGRDLLKRFGPDGTLHYLAQPGKPDFGRTHFARDANGHTAAVVVRVLQCAAVSGDPQLLGEGLRLLKALDRFNGSVPRGAQTWEVPLHTPDVLASAHLVKAYVLGHDLTGEPAFLDQAKYWAWTGLPFVYLDDPTGKAVGTYATIPVFGASSWIDVWFGRPVQWCGLAYAEALYDLCRHDRSGPWKRIADGITASGIQQTWPPSDADRRGLLPDFYHLADQVRDGPAINPGTLQACAARTFGGSPIYSFHRFHKYRVIVHAPGAILDTAEDDQTPRFTVDGWPVGPYFVMVSGLAAAPRVKVDGRHLPPGDRCRYHEGEGRLILQVQGHPRVELGLQ